MPNLRFVALRIPEIIGGTVKILEVPGYANAPFFPQILRVFCSHGRCEILNLVDIRVPEIIGGTAKIWADPGYARAPFCRKFLKGFCLDGHCEYTCQI